MVSIYLGETELQNLYVGDVEVKEIIPPSDPDEVGGYGLSPYGLSPYGE